MSNPTETGQAPKPFAAANGSAEYYLLQMLERLKEHGEYRVRWEWAIRHMMEWKDCAEDLGKPHYILEPELRSAKFREALKGYENLTRTNDMQPNDQAEPLPPDSERGRH